MRFNWVPRHYHSINSINVRKNYKAITKSFCQFYFNLYDNNFLALKKLYKPNSLFIFIDEEFVGFDAVYGKIMHNNIFKFKHHDMNVNAQPVDNNSLLITINGTVSINYDYRPHNFTETILLRKNHNNNNFFVSNTIFNLHDINDDACIDEDLEI
uniref:Nuclear transport factor 2 domain protein n=1 Tax=Mimivirus LCMiAC01 TaxID=2506608 RepID=A0A481YYX0_9VIRU|nr:MAG: nuclear transport factor 2 domain protein [Mimivirus LCMiAC01]